MSLSIHSIRLCPERRNRVSNLRGRGSSACLLDQPVLRQRSCRDGLEEMVESWQLHRLAFRVLREGHGNCGEILGRRHLDILAAIERKHRDFHLREDRSGIE